MLGHVEAVIRHDHYGISAEINNVSGIIGERFIKLFPVLAAEPEPYIVKGTAIRNLDDRFIGISFTCTKLGFIIWFVSGFKEVTLTKKDRVHIFFQDGTNMSFNMFSGRLTVGPYRNGNLATVTPIQMAHFCDNNVESIIAESGTTGVQVKVLFTQADNNRQYNEKTLGSKMILQAARTITVTQQNLSRLS